MILHSILAIATSAAIFISLPFASRVEASDNIESSSGSISFACATWQELSYEGISYRDGDEYQPVQIGRGQCSQLHVLGGGDSLELYSSKENGAGELAYELIGLAPMISGAEQMLFLVDEADGLGDLPLSLRGFDNSLDLFPLGAFRFVNLTPDPLQVTFGEETAELPAGLFAIVKVQGSQNEGLVSFYLKDAEDVTVYENRLFGQASARQTVVIYPPSREGRSLKLKFLSQQPTVESSDLMETPSTPLAVQTTTPATEPLL